MVVRIWSSVAKLKYAKSSHTETDTSIQGEVGELVDHLFRHKSGQIVSILTGIFGFRHFDLAEDVVQETLVKALQRWPFSGIPENPAGWILQAAKNQAVDVLRRRALFHDKQEEIVRQLERQLQPSDHPYPFQDEQLGLMFACCHTAFPQDVQITLVLKTLCGFSVSEIARAFLTKEPTIAQKLVRAKRKIHEKNLNFELPEQKRLSKRLDAVLQVLYLMFNEGYSSSKANSLIRTDICYDAIRLTTLLTEHSAGDEPKTHALLALMLFQASRFATRVDSEGNLLLLADQDRKLWDKKLIQRAFLHLERAGRGDQLTTHHLQAGIASYHALAADYESTDWRQILSLYDALVELDPSPIAKLNRSVAVSMVSGPAAGLYELERITRDPTMDRYPLYHATLADFHRRLGNVDQAIAYYTKTLELAYTEPERNFVERKLAGLKRRG